MEIKMDPEALQSLAAKAIFDGMDESTRDNIMKQAIEGLLTPSKNGYSVGKTPLQEAFDRAIGAAAHRVVQEKIANDPAVSAEIEKLLGPLVNGILDVEGQNYNTSLSSKIGTAVGDWLSDIAQERSQR